MANLQHFRQIHHEDIINTPQAYERAFSIFAFDMKRILLFLFLLPVLCPAQKGIDNLWMMGYSCCTSNWGGINMDFYSGSIFVSYVNRKMNFQDLSATMCDSMGNVLFYTNSAYIANANNDTMQNGSGLSPSYWTSTHDSYGMFIPQSAVIIPQPANPNRFFLIHGTIDDSIRYAHRIYFSEIDMSMNGGLGAVTTKNNILLYDTLISGSITACKHANGRDWWVVSHKAESNVYHIFLADPSGIRHYASQAIGAVRNRQNKGQVCFSPDGSKFANYDGDAYYTLNADLDIMDFDRCKGTFSNLVHVDIKDSSGAGGVAFSSDSKILYVSSTWYVYQFDLIAANIPASKTTVAIYDGYYSVTPSLKTTFYLAGLAPDGKIYISSTNGVLTMHVINNPGVVGMSCDVCQHCISLPAYNAFTIPNHPNYHLGPLVGSSCDTLTSVQSLSVQGSKLGVFPNPVSSTGEVAFTYPSTGEVKSIAIYNTEGKEVARYELPQWSSVQKVKLPELAKGIYLARLWSENGAANTPFVIQ